jgi:hypothetical protein
VTGPAGATRGSTTHQAGASVPGDPGALDLPQLYSPAEAAAVLRDAGLRDMTECALRTRAYRKQVPFHRNGRRIVFTLSDLRAIAAGEQCLPQPPEVTAVRTARPRPARHHPASRRATASADPWRARQPRGCDARDVHMRRQEPGASGARMAGQRDASPVPHHSGRPANATGTSARSRMAHGTGA